MKECKIITIANHKGGVAKTTTAINLAAGILEVDHSSRVLLIDTDPQCNLTMAMFPFKKQDYETALTMIDVFSKKAIDNEIKKSNIKGVDIIASHQNLCLTEKEILGTPRSINGMGSFISKGHLKEQYDFIIIDTPPSPNSPFTVSALTCSDYYILCIKSEDCFSLEGMGHFESLAQEVMETTNPELILLGHVLTMYDGRNKTCQLQESIARSKYGESVFKSIIRTNTDISRANGEKVSIFQRNKWVNGAKDYLDFTKEFLERISN